MPRLYQQQAPEQLRHTIERLTARIVAAERDRDFRSANRLISNRARARRLVSDLEQACENSTAGAV